MSQTSEVHAGDEGPGARRRLAVVQPAPGGRRLVQRWGIVGATIGALGAFTYSLLLPWWHFWLFAPQYPKGLELVVSLTGVRGDVAEVNELNHYIGMKHLDQAAIFERHIAFWAVAVLGAEVLVLMLSQGRRLYALSATLAATFPIGFVADSWYWLYRFGHELDPHAAVHIKAFTPQLFGTGKIGQFETFASPELGFLLAAAGVVIIAVASLLRARVCRSCARAGRCGAVCPSLLVGPGAGRDEAGKAA